MNKMWGLALTVALIPAQPVLAAEGRPLEQRVTATIIPAQLDDAQRAAYQSIFAAIRSQKWLDARLQLATSKAGPLHSVAMALVLTSKGSPKAAMEDITRLLAEAPELPQAEMLARLAKARGATEMPTLPYTRALSWTPGAPARVRAKSSKSDRIAADLAISMHPLVKQDRAVEAQLLLEATPGLSPDALTEWQQKVAWMYFLTGDDSNARSMAAKASAGTGDWSVSADWIAGLAAWRQQDFAGSAAYFATVASRTADVELRSAAFFWGSRATMAAGKPDQVTPLLKSAAQYGETFYGLLARQSLGLKPVAESDVEQRFASDWEGIGKRANVRTAAALVEIGETALAEDLLKRQARIGDTNEFPALVRIAGALDLPSTQIWLAHNAPVGAAATVASRFPAPNWKPDGGWRVDKALVYAHTLQESGFRTDVVSPAGAYGLMQIRPAAATDIARQRGVSFDRSALSRPSTNIEIGQSYLELLRDRPATGGLLPKVIAAYNAGPMPVEGWNTQIRDGGDPLLYIESIPYWETRGYVVTVMRNYWVYETEMGKAGSPSRAALAQGLWPRFPGLTGATAVRIAARSAPQVTASAN